MNQDEKASGGGMAGLTFQFTKSVGTVGSVSAGTSWHSSPLGAFFSNTVQPGFAQSVSASLAQVKKTSLMNNTVATTVDTVFPISHYEVFSYSDAATAKLGVGPNKDSRYLRFTTGPGDTSSDKHNSGLAYGMAMRFYNASKGAYVNYYTANGYNIYGNDTQTVYPCFCF